MGLVSATPLRKMFTPYRRFLRLPVLLAFVALCASAQGPATSNAPAVAAKKRTTQTFDASFTDVASPAGLTAPLLYGGADKKTYIMEVNGAGAALLDIDGDDLLDVFLVNGSALKDADQSAVSRLYRNQGDGKFQDITANSGVGRHGWGTGVCAGDYDNDGKTDLYVAYWGKNSLYRNQGRGKFQDAASAAGVAGGAQEWTSGCTFVDYDQDGDLDLLTTQYQQFDLAKAKAPGQGSTCQWKGMPVFCGPRGLPYGGVTLYRNDGAGKFTDVTADSGVADVSGYYAFTAVAADFTNDGFPDIYVACDSTPNLFFINNGDGTFTDFATETGLAFNEHGHEQGGMGLAVGDYDRDGELDIVKTNFAGDYPNVYHNLGDGIFEDMVVRAGLAVNPQFVGWGVGLVDLDNDGLQDVFQVNGHVYPELDTQDRVAEDYRQASVVYRNIGDGRFEDVTDLAGPAVSAKLSSRGAAFGDIDNDGDIDVLVLNMGDPPSLLRNDLANSNHWTRIRLQGTDSNRDAVGATIRLTAGGVTQTRVVLSQDSYISHSDLRAHFGLGRADQVSGVVVQWPNGETEEFPGFPADRGVLLIEGSGQVEEVE